MLTVSITHRDICGSGAGAQLRTVSRNPLGECREHYQVVPLVTSTTIRLTAGHRFPRPSFLWPGIRLADPRSHRRGLICQWWSRSSIPDQWSVRPLMSFVPFFPPIMSTLKSSPWTTEVPMVRLDTWRSGPTRSRSAP